jgi:hypothetical protein
MHQLIYTSEASPALSSEDLFKIIEQSARNNPSADITGFLIYRGRSFFQLVEGPLLALEVLLETLRGDSRHSDITVVSCLPVEQRSFPRWRMKRVGESGDVVAELLEALATDGNGRPLPDAVREFLQSQRAAA